MSEWDWYDWLCAAVLMFTAYHFGAWRRNRWLSRQLRTLNETLERALRE